MRSQWNSDPNPSTRKGSRTVAAGTGSQHLGRALQNSVRVKIKAGPAQPQQKPKNSLQDAAGAEASGNSHTFSRGISLQQLLHCHHEEGENNS